MSAIRKTVHKLNNYADSLRAQGLSPSSVHHILLERAFNILKENSGAKADIIAPMMKYMLHVVKKPDNKNDYEKGMGRHYYCAVSYAGKTLYPVCGYYPNGLGRFGKSARSMLEENYTMALTMYHAGFIKQASSFLGRAVHMLCDICCLPHSACMTYFSPSGKLHHAYEDAAELLYPDKVPPAHQNIDNFFSDRNSFESSLNNISETVCAEIPQLHRDPITEITGRLYDSELKTANLLYRFTEDIRLSPQEAHYITDGTELIPLGAPLAPIKVRVTENGLALIQKGKRLAHTYSRNKKYFSAAYRMNNLFTIAPARSQHNLVITDGSFKSFDPRNKDQFFTAQYPDK